MNKNGFICDNSREIGTQTDNIKRKKVSRRCKEKLKIRYKSEHVNRSIAKYVRISLRQDKSISSYMNFVFISCGILFNSKFIK